jgi:hypothetical protein
MALRLYPVLSPERLSYLGGPGKECLRQVKELKKLNQKSKRLM